MSNHPDESKLNLFAIPSQTTVLFTIIMVVVGLPVLISGSSRSFLLLPVLPMVVSSFALWDFLGSPRREQRRLDMKPLVPRSSAEDAADGLPVDDRVFGYVDKLAQEAGLPRSPRLFVAQVPLQSPFAFGTWRQRYLALPDWLANLLDRPIIAPYGDDARYLETILRHELAHFANHDVWLTFFARSLLKMTVWVMLAQWFASLWTPIFYVALQRDLADWRTVIPSPFLPLLPADIQEFLANPPPMTPADIAVILLMVSMAFLPLVVGALFLWVTEWRLLLRVRELYCDARVAAWQHSGPRVTLISSWLQQQLYFSASGQPAPVTLMSRLTDNLPVFIPRFFTRVTERVRTLSVIDHTLESSAKRYGEIKKKIALHPMPTERERALFVPHTVYGSSRRIGLRAGMAVFMLYIVFGSIFSPAQQGMNSGPIIGFGFLVMALSLAPGHIAALPSWQGIKRRIRAALLCFVLLINVPIALMLLVATFTIAIMPGVIDLPLYAIAMVAPGDLSEPIIDNPGAYIGQAWVGSFMTFAVGLPILLAAALLLHAAVTRQVLHWYGAPIWRRSSAVFLAIAVGLALLLWHGALPLLDWIAFPGIFEPDWIFAARLALSALAAATIGVLFWRMNRRYARRCPACGEVVEDPYCLGLRCPACNELLNPWLLAEY